MQVVLRKYEFVTPQCLDIPGAGPRINLSRADQLDTDNGWAIAKQDSPVGSEGDNIGEGATLREILVTQRIRDLWFKHFGTTPEGDTMDEFLFDHMEGQADYTGAATARPLSLVDGSLEIWLGTREKVMVPFANGTAKERAAFVRVLQRVRSALNEARTLSKQGVLPADFYRKLLVVEARKMGVTPAALKPKTWRANETPVDPETTVDDSFGSFSKYTRATGVGTWTCNSGLYVYREPWNAVNDTVKHNTAMSSNDNWTDLTVQTTSGQTLGNGTEFGPMCRFGSNGSACYLFGTNVSAGGASTPRLIRFAPSSNTITHVAWCSLYDYATYGRLLVFRCKAVGSSITSQTSGNGHTLTDTATDTTITTGLYGGVGSYDGWNSGYATIKVANSITITDGVASPPVVTSDSASGTVGSAFSYNITATNTPTSYGASSLPTGLSVNNTTGAITGTPTEAGTFTVNTSASNTGGTGTGTVTITIAKANTTTTLGVSPSSPQVAGTAVTLTATVPSGVTGTVTFYNNDVSIGTGTVSGTTATITTSSLPVGTNSLTASYGGDSNYNSSTSGASSYVIRSAGSRILLMCTRRRRR